MGARQKAWAVRARQAIVEQLGGRCAFCGGGFNLELDHLGPRGWSCRAVDSSHRIAFYRREAAAGQLQVLCSYCNKSKGQPNYESQIECPF